MSNLSSKRDISITTYVFGLVGVIGFGGTLPFTTLALSDFSPAFITCFRALIAALFAGSALLLFQKPLRHKDDRLIFVAGVLLIFAFPGMMALAMQTVPASHGGVVLGFLPLATAFFSRIYTGEKSSALFWFLSLSGAMIVVAYTLYKNSAEEKGSLVVGDIWLILAGLSAACGYVLFGKLSQKTPGWEIISRALILNFPLILIGSIWVYEPHFLSPSTNGLIGLLYVGSISMFLAFCAWNIALAKGGIAKIGQLQLLQTFVTIIVAAILLEETIDAITILTAMIITFIIFVSRKA